MSSLELVPNSFERVLFSPDRSCISLYSRESILKNRARVPMRGGSANGFPPIRFMFPMCVSMFFSFCSFYCLSLIILALSSFKRVNSVQECFN